MQKRSQAIDAEQIIKEFEADMKGHPLMAPQMPMPISSREYPGKEHPNKNTDQVNRIMNNDGSTNQTGDDQDAINDMGGYLPITASRKRKLRLALFDEQQMPAGMDFQQMGDVTEFNQQDPINQQVPFAKKRDWQTQLTDKDNAMKEYIRNKGPQDQIPTGLWDFDSQSSNTDALG